MIDPHIATVHRDEDLVGQHTIHPFRFDEDFIWCGVCGGRRVSVPLRREASQRQLTIEAPECLYDMKARSASSAGPLKIILGEDRMLVTGEGFLWQQAQASLIISNRVRTLVRELPNSKAKP